MLSDWSKPNRLRYYYLAAALCLALVPTSAQAQIYKSYDANGHPVYSGRPVRPTDKTYQVAGAGSLRVTRSVTGRSADYDDLIKQHSRLNGVRTDLVRAVVQVESGFNAFARSPKGAMGLMQLMPETAQQFGVRHPFNASENLAAGTAYLRQLLDRYGNDEELALAAYNAGPGAVDKHGLTVPPFRETRQYVSKINSLTAVNGPGANLSAPRVAVATTAVARAAPAEPTFYRSIEVINGREIIKLSDTRPSSGSYEILR